MNELDFKEIHTTKSLEPLWRHFVLSEAQIRICYDALPRELTNTLRCTAPNDQNFILVFAGKVTRSIAVQIFSHLKTYYLPQY